MNLLEYSFELPKKFFENINPNIINVLYSYIHNISHDEYGRYYVVQYIDDMKNIYYVDDFNSKEIYYLIYLSLTISRTEIVCELLDIYQDVNVSDYNNVLLNLACYRGQYSVISKLINAGVDVTCNNNIAIKLASLMCNNTYTYRDDDIIMILKILLENGADIHLDNEFVLCNASHNIYVFKYLLQLDYKYDITIRDNYCLQKCVHNYFNNIINYYDKFEGQEFSSIVKSGENVLFDINKNEFVVSDVIEILLDLGADINCNNGYIINDIVKYRDKYLIELFIKYGANMSLLNVDSLLNIIKMMDCDIIKILMENGVDFSQLNNEPVKNLQKINTANLLLEIGLNLEKTLNKLILLMFNDDVIMNIMNYLSDRDKIIFASINHNMRFFLDKLCYTELHNYEYVKKLDYVERFKRVSYKISNGSNILIPNIVTDLIIKCGYYNNLIIPTHIIHITVCDCMCSKMKYIIDQRIKITINNQLSKCNNFPRYDKRFGGALTLLAANSYQDPYITIDTDKPKILLKNKYNCSRNHNQYFKNTNKYNKRIQKYNY